MKTWIIYIWDKKTGQSKTSRIIKTYSFSLALANCYPSKDDNKPTYEYITGIEL